MGNDPLSATSQGAGSASAALRLDDVEKRYPGTQALDGVTMSVARGEIHALLGGNGSGKSTLIKILAGVESADAGTLHVAGTKYSLDDWSPALSWQADLRFVHQQSAVVPDLSVAENLAIGHGFETGRARRIRWRAQISAAQGILERFSIDVAPTALMREIGPAQQNMVAIARALQDQDGRHSGVLILDEPTASLPDREADILLGALRRYADLGQTIVYVSHRLDEVLRVADRATVLRDGEVVGELSGDSLNHDRLVELIVGGTLNVRPRRARAPARGTAMLELEHLAGGAANDVTLRVASGEIVGVAGLLGSGRSSLLHSIFGAVPRTGAVRVDGALIGPGSIDDSMESGIALVPEHRAVEAAFPDLDVGSNLSVASLRSYWNGLRLNRSKEAADSEELASRYAVKASSLSAPLGTLSGGNQQKVIVARWLRRSPRVLLLDEPSQGVDVGARAEIHDLVRSAADDGAAGLVVSSDFEELVELVDRAVVIAGGRIIDELAGDEMTDDRLAQLVHSDLAAA